MSVTALDPTLEFLGLFADQTEDVILARWVDWANEGLDPVADASSWTDTREGSHWRTCVLPMVREVARLYDLASTEVPMSGFVLWAWGSYLDDLAAVYRVSRLPATPATGMETFAGPPGSVVTQGTTVGVTPVSASAPAPTFVVQDSVTIPAGGSIDTPIQATLPGADTNVAASAITVPSTPLPAGVTAINAAPTLGGSDVETDEALRARVLQAVSGRGPGAVQDYVAWAGAWPGVGSVKVIPVWNGPNSVMVVIDDADGRPLPPATVAALQQDLDPTAGKGDGTAPVGAQVTVGTSTLLPLTVAGTVAFATGFSSDGTGGTEALHDPIFTAIDAYMRSVKPGDQVTLSHVAGIIATWPGVVDVTGVTIAGAAANVVLALNPPQAASLQTLTI